MQSRGSGLSGFLAAKSGGAPLPSKKAAVQTIFEFSASARAGKAAKCSEEAGAAPKRTAAPQPACPPPRGGEAGAGGAEGPPESAAVGAWGRLVSRQAGREACARRAARKWLRLLEAAGRRRRLEESEQARRVPNRWLLLCSLQAERAARGQGLAKQWLKLAAAQAGRARAAEWQGAERASALAAARKSAEAAREAGAPRFLLSGSWDGWVPHRMTYSHRHQCYRLTVERGAGGGHDTFKILGSDGREICAGLKEGEVRLLRDEEGKSEPSVGVDSDDGKLSLFHDIRLHIDGDGNALRVDTCRLGKFAESPARRYWVSGTWDNWAAHEMNWDPDRHCFSFELKVGSNAKESFRVLVNGKRHLAWYPDVRDATFHTSHAIYGPDSAAHGRSWTIGKHALDMAADGAAFEVRLRLQPDGSLLDVDWVRVEGGAAAAAAPEGSVDAAAAAMRAYGRRLAEARVPGGMLASGPALLEAPGAGAASLGGAAARAAPREAERAPAPVGPGAAGRAAAVCWDSDGEELLLCRRCSLPLGELGYAAPDGGGERVHGECLAQLVIEDVRRQDEERLRRDAELKGARRAEYGIGWRAERIPRSEELARRLRCSPPARGMCCLVLEPGSNEVRVAPTAEPAASVNLAYLSVALVVRLREGREPFFSLDPLKAASYIPYAESRMQVKRFVPHWLAGTSVGEVLFQADYHLKELSMGEYEQPVLGMADCRDLAGQDEASRDWSGREWFVVREADVRVSEDNVLVPSVSMGVEARAQVVGDFGLEDAKLTRPDHPLVRYAEAFTKNFDLIAERKSVIFNLRELAKATVLAKFLVDAQIPLDDSWFGLADEELGPCTMQIPQLWNERLYSSISVEGGRIDAAATGVNSRLHGVYGGIDFGLDRMAMAGLIPAMPTAPRAEAMLVSRGPAPTAFSMIGGGLPTGRAKMTPTLRAAIAPTVRAQGVDLDLGKIDLSSASRFPGSLLGDDASSGALATPGDAFWSALHAGTAAKPDEDWRALLREVFHPALSDRQSEGDRFVPPRTCASYLAGLRDLVEAEGELRRRRQERFLSADFAADGLGALFPRSWRSSVGVAGGGAPRRAPGALLPRADLDCEPGALQRVLRPSALVFDEASEDGARFRIYRLDRTEVRTTQAPGGQEVVGAVFSVGGPAPPRARGAPDDRSVSPEQRIVKATQYVESGGAGEAALLQPREAKGRASAPALRYYVVLETEQGASISTERLADGRVAFDCCPKDLENRNSFARVLHSACCQGGGLKVGELKRRVSGSYASLPASSSRGKKYTRDVMGLVGGQAQ